MFEKYKMSTIAFPTIFLVVLLVVYIASAALTIRAYEKKSHQRACSSFPNHDAAQKYYDEDRSSRKRLDANHNGIACEELIGK